MTTMNLNLNLFVVTQILNHSAIVKFIYTVFPSLHLVIFLTSVLIVDLYLRAKSWDNVLLFPHVRCRNTCSTWK